MEAQNILTEKCSVCATPCNKFCSGCKKVYYCSTSHQKADRKIHKKDCFPAKLISDEAQGRHFVATKDLKPGDLVFKDKAVVSGPSGAEPFFHKICLGCYNVVKTKYVCSQCKWPVCSPKCEKIRHHADFECKIFEAGQIGPIFTKPYEYDFIKFLRSLLLKEIEPCKWDELKTLASHAEARSESQEAVLTVNLVYKFISETCKLLGKYDYETVDHVVGIWGVNSFGANPPSGPYPTGSMASFLFPRTSLASHSCVANTRGILQEKIRDSAPCYSMELLASLPIKSGDPIHITYADVGEGTFERRQVLLDNYYFSCTCPRCSSPTEFETYFSAFKCSNAKSKCGGYLLMEDPLDFNSAWKCDKCGEKSSYERLALSIFKIKTEIQTSMQNYGQGNRKEEIKILEKILKENQGVTVHRNHWLMMEIEFELIQRMVVFIRKTGGKPEIDLLAKLTELCEHCLQIANILRPGHNSYRGKILYCLCQAKLLKLNCTPTLEKGADNGKCDRVKNEDFLFQRKNLESVKELGEEGWEILSREPEGSEERRIAGTLKQDLEHIKKMLTLLQAQLKGGIYC